LATYCEKFASPTARNFRTHHCIKVPKGRNLGDLRREVDDYCI
jgi:hypothetical protein